MPTDRDTSNVVHERARRAVFGFLASAVLHETNNVLTVMAGVRQLLRAGQTLSDRVGSMIDQQLMRMEELVSAIRRIGPEDTEPRKGPRGVAFVMDAIERVVQIAGKGRGLALERELLAIDPKPNDPEALALGTLLVILPALPRRGRASGQRVALRAAQNGGLVRIDVEIAPLDDDGGGEPEVEVARALLAQVGGRLACERRDGTLLGAVSVPCE